MPSTPILFYSAPVPQSTSTKIVFPHKQVNNEGVFVMDDFNPVSTQGIISLEEVTQTLATFNIKNEDLGVSQDAIAPNHLNDLIWFFSMLFGIISVGAFIPIVIVLTSYFFYPLLGIIIFVPAFIYTNKKR